MSLVAQSVAFHAAAAVVVAVVVVVVLLLMLLLLLLFLLLLTLRKLTDLLMTQTLVSCLISVEHYGRT